MRIGNHVNMTLCARLTAESLPYLRPNLNAKLLLKSPGSTLTLTRDWTLVIGRAHSKSLL